MAKGDGEPAEVVRAKRVELVDDGGRVRVVLGDVGADLTLCDVGGAPVVELRRCGLLRHSY